MKYMVVSAKKRDANILNDPKLKNFQNCQNLTKLQTITFLLLPFCVKNQVSFWNGIHFNPAGKML